MNKLTAIANKYCLTYNFTFKKGSEELVSRLQQVQQEFPNAELASSRDDAVKYVISVAPDLIYTYMICNLGGLKQCSTVAPYFAAKASSDGFATLIATKPGHQYNLMLTKEGSLGVDLTRIQFEVNRVAAQIESEEWDEKWDDYDPYGEERATQQLKKELEQNPFRTVRVWPTSNLDGVPPRQESLFGEFVIHPKPELQKKDHPDYGSEADPDMIYLN